VAALACRTRPGTRRTSTTLCVVITFDNPLRDRHAQVHPTSFLDAGGSAPVGVFPSRAPFCEAFGYVPQRHTATWNRRTNIYSSHLNRQLVRVSSNGLGAVRYQFDPF
jgi:hypothetical protein